METGNEPYQPSLKELVEISHYYGKNNEYVIAGGGNTSFKNEEKIWIKASGTSLDNIDEDDFVCLSRKELKKISTKSYSQNPLLRESQVKEDLNKAILYPAGKRPSVETSLHEIIDFRFVVHTHPTKVNALLCSRKAKSLSRKLFGKQTLFIEYTDPGYVLFKKIEEKITGYREKYGSVPQVILLQNHGIFVSADSIQEIRDLYSGIEIILQENLEIKLPVESKHPSVEYGKKICGSIASALDIDPAGVLLRNNILFRHFINSAKSFEKVGKPFTPDDIVYCKSVYLFSSSAITDIKDEVQGFNDRFGYLPKIIALKGQGLIAIDSSQKSAGIVLDVFENMMKVSYLSENFGGPQFMTPEQINFIDNWEVENYRRTLNF